MGTRTESRRVAGQEGGRKLAKKVREHRPREEQLRSSFSKGFREGSGPWEEERRVAEIGKKWRSSVIVLSRLLFAWFPERARACRGHDRDSSVTTADTTRELSGRSERSYSAGTM